MKNGLAIAAGLFVLAMLLGLIQLWFCPWTPEVFLKLELTLAVLLAIVLTIWFVIREYHEDRTTRSGEKLDD